VQLTPRHFHLQFLTLFLVLGGITNRKRIASLVLAEKHSLSWPRTIIKSQDSEQDAAHLIRKRLMPPVISLWHSTPSTGSHFGIHWHWYAEDASSPFIVAKRTSGKAHQRQSNFPTNLVRVLNS